MGSTILSVACGSLARAPRRRPVPPLGELPRPRLGRAQTERVAVGVREDTVVVGRRAVKLGDRSAACEVVDDERDLACAAVAGVSRLQNGPREGASEGGRDRGASARGDSRTEARARVELAL